MAIKHTATILKIAKLQYFNKKLSDFDEIGYTTAHLELDDSQMTKYEYLKKFKMTDSRHFKNRFLAITQQPISVKFCTWKQNHMVIKVLLFCSNFFVYLHTNDTWQVL